MYRGDELTSADRDEQIGVVLNDFLDRRAQGEPISEADLLRNHPSLAAELREHLVLLRDLRPPGDYIQRLIHQQILTPPSDGDHVARLAHYQIRNLVGRGGMGVVLRGFDPRLHRAVAIKLLRPEFIDDTTALVRFQREARAVASLSHPNIVAIHDIARVEGLPYLVMEYIAGTNLATVLNLLGPLPAPLTRHIFRELITGLAVAHRDQLVHRDVKPSNILLDGWTAEQLQHLAAAEGPPRFPYRPPRVKLVDFGLARLQSTHQPVTRSLAVLGTPEYMSPEQARGDTQMDHRTDLYAAGVVLYEMLCGRSPFRGNSPTATLNQILTVEPEPPRASAAAAAPDLEQLALRLMAKDREQRLPTANHVLEALAAKTPVKLPGRRKRSIRRALLASVAITAALLGAALFRTGDAAPAAIRHVRVDPDVPNVLQVRRGDRPTWQIFATLPDDARISRATLVSSHEKTGPHIIATLEKPSLGQRANLMAFDTRGEVTWQRWLGTTDVDWPDCESSNDFRGALLAVGDVLPAHPGTEVIATVSHWRDYPTLLTVLDPQSGASLRSFWHMGHLYALRIVPQALPESRPAIVTWGYNNKLDGFHAPADGDPRPLTNVDHVPVVMVLDPEQMDGLSPPRTERVPFPTADPWAYAMLDLSPWLPPDASAGITDVQILPPGEGAAPHDGPWLQVQVHAGNAERISLAVLRTDTALQLDRLEMHDYPAVPITPLQMRLAWQPLYSHGVAVFDRELLPLHPHRGAAITQVELDPQDRRRVQIRFAGQDQPQTITPEIPGARIAAAAAARRPGGQSQVIIALDEPTELGNVVACDSRGRVRWHRHLQEPGNWPDYAEAAYWTAYLIKTGDFDGSPGDEVVVVTSDAMEYPTIVVTLDGETGAEVGRLRHQGDLSDLHVVENFFADGRAAIAAIGLNNKLDGPNTRTSATPAPLARFDLVPILMILDPLHLDGIAPPRSSDVAHWPAGTQHAYAFVDQAYIASTLLRPHDGSPDRFPQPNEIASIGSFMRAPYHPDDPASEPWLSVSLHSPDIEHPRAILVVDRDLHLRRIVDTIGNPHRESEEFWRQNWRVLPPHAAAQHQK